jgi:PAS domain S-box-containing protein
VSDDARTFRALFETAPDAMLVVDTQGRIVLANAQTEKMFGIARSALLGQPVETLIPERYREGHVRYREAYVEQPNPRPMGAGLALYGRRADGSEFPVEVALSPIETDGRRLFAASVRDVSELERTRQMALRSRYSSYVARFGIQALAQPEFDALIGAAAPLVAEAMQADAAVVFRVTHDRKELRCASSAGIGPEVAAGIRVPNDSSYLPGYVVAQRAPVVVPDIATETRFAILEVFGQLGLRSAVGVPLFGSGGDAVGVLTARTRAPRRWNEDDVHFLQAIANVVAAAMERAVTEERLLHAQRLEALGQLTGGVAHDFNNLLMVIGGNLQMLEESAAGRPAELELARQAMSATERGAMLTRKLLAFARKQPLNPQPFDLNQLVGDIRDLLRRTLGEAVTVRTVLDPGLPVLVADPAQVETALLNLALNARDAMPEGGLLTLQTHRVRLGDGDLGPVAELRPGEYAVLSVTDTGCGMPPEVAARAFEPFFTTKAPGKGNGLGLSMVYGFARQSGGTARLYSEPGRGTTARIYLPLPEQAQRTTHAEARQSLPTGTGTVLVVEDDPAVRAVAVAFLGRLGYRVLEAADAESALRLLRGDAEVDLLFTDLVLPGMDGIALASEARLQRPSLAVLYVTGFASGSLIQRLPPGEAANVLSKPYRREELAAKVHRALAARRG